MLSDHRPQPKTRVLNQDQFVALDGNAHLLDITLQTINIPHIRLTITSCLLGYEISRFIAAFRLAWTRKEKAICIDMIRNVFKEDPMAGQWIEQRNTIVLLGQDVNTIMRRVRMPLMKLDTSKDSDRINIYSVFLRKVYTREAPGTTLDVIAVLRSADSMIQLRCMMVKPSIHSYGALKLNAVINGHLVITLFEGDFVRTVVINKDSTFSHTVKLQKGGGEERSCTDKLLPAMLLKVQHMDSRGLPNRSQQFGHVPLVRQ